MENTQRFENHPSKTRIQEDKTLTMPNPGAARIRKVGFTCLLLGIVFGGLEALCRLTLPPAGPVHALKPGLRWAQPPNQHQAPWGGVGTDIEFLVNTNGHGLRVSRVGTDYALDDELTTTIVYLGDSIIFGWGNQDHETVPAQLQSTLQASDTSSKYQVINAGQPGYSSMQSFLLFENVLTAYKPDIVLLQLAQHNVVAREIPDSRSISVDATTEWNLKLLELSRLYRFVHKHIVRALAQSQPAAVEDDRKVERSLAHLIEGGGIEAAARIGETTLDPKTRVPPEDLRDILEAMAHLGTQQGFKLYVYFQGKRRPHEDLSPWTDVVDALESEGKLAHLRIYEELEWAGQNLPSLYLHYSPGHFNPYGAGVLAVILRNALRNDGLFSNTTQSEAKPKDEGK